MSDNASLTASRDDRVAEVLDAYLEAMKAGVPPDMDELLARYPDLAEDLKECLASLAFIRQAEISVNGSTSDGDGMPNANNSVGVLGDFRILREVGKGGMGIVYEAEQMSLGRRVALKILPFAATMDPRQLQRFHNEARAAASLEHPHIVPVYGVGCERGVHYFAMKFIDGRTLSEAIAAMRPAPESQPRASSGAPQLLDGRGSDRTSPVAVASTQPATRDAAAFRQIANWGIQAANALEHAHSIGIIHRDIKPANLMIDAQGKLWVTDFGLARTAADAGLTMTGDVLGTLRYMSPEQALAKHGLVDNRTDVYSLGLTLYELLTGTPAVKGKDREEILNAITLEEPRPPRALDAAIPQDLETIVLKAMEKNPADRYASALALADDLGRFLDDKPIWAKRPRLLHRVKKWSRRHGEVVLAGTILLALALGLASVGTLMLWLKEKEKDEALGWAQTARQQAEASEARLRHHLYAADIKLAYQEWLNGRLLMTLDRLARHRPVGDQKDLRGFEWYYLQRLCHPELRTLPAHERGVHSVAYSHDSRLLATAGGDGTVKIWAADTGLLQTTIHAHDRCVNWVEFSSDDRLLASASDDATTKIWELPTNKLHVTIQKQGEQVVGVAFLPDGTILAAGLQERVLKLWDIKAPDACLTLTLPPDEVFESLRASHDGKTIAAGTRKGTIRLWDRSTGQHKATLKGHSMPVRDVVFSHDNRRLASACQDGTVKLWDLATGMEQATFEGHTSAVQTVAFSPDDYLASAGMDSNVRIWDMGRRALFDKVLRGHTGRVWEIRFAPDGQTLASASADDTVKLWRWRSPYERRPFHHCHPAMLSVVFSPDSRRLATGKGDGTVQLWDCATRQHLATLASDQSPVVRVVFASDGTLAAGCSDGSILLWERSTTKKPLKLTGDGVTAEAAMALSADGRTLATGMRDGSVRLRDSATGHVLADLPGNSAVFPTVAFAPDGLTLASGAPDGRVWLWDVKKREKVDELRGLREYAHWLVYSPDGRFLAGRGYDGNIAIWDLARKGEPHFVSQKQRGNQIAFSPDSKTLASASGDEVTLWSVATGQEMIRLQRPHGDIRSVAFSPDGQILATAGLSPPPDWRGGEVSLWLAPREEVTAASGSRQQ